MNVQQERNEEGICLPDKKDSVCLTGKKDSTISKKCKVSDSTQSINSIPVSIIEDSQDCILLKVPSQDNLPCKSTNVTPQGTVGKSHNNSHKNTHNNTHNNKSNNINRGHHNQQNIRSNSGEYYNHPHYYQPTVQINQEIHSHPDSIINVLNQPWIQPHFLMSNSFSAALAKVAWRKGKWIDEEEIYTKKLIEAFNAGMLKISSGTTLRSFLSEKLSCDPMRITKKFAGSSCIGKQVYSPADGSVDPAELKKIQDELDDLETKFRAKVDLHVPPQISAQALAMALHMKAKSMPAYFEGFSPEAIVAMTQAPSYPSQVHPVMMKSRPQEIRSQVRLPEIPPYYMDKLDTYPMTHPNQQLQRMQNDEYSQSNNSVPVTVNGPFQNEKQGKIGLLNPISQASAFRSLGAQESQSQEKFAQWFLPKQPSTESQNLLSRDAAPRNRFVEMWNRDLVKFNPDSLTSVTEQLLNRSKNSIDGTSSSSSVNQNDLDASDLLLNFFKAANGNDSEVEAALKRNGLENIRENREALSSFYQNIEIPIKQSSGEISSENNSSLTSGEDNSNSTGSEKNSNESDDVDSSSDSGKNSTTSKYDENSGADKDLDTITTISKLSKESRDRKKEKKLRKYTSENHYNTKSRKEIDKETQQIGAEHSKYYGLNSYSNTNANKKRANQLSNQDFEKETESKRIKLD